MSTTGRRPLSGRLVPTAGGVAGALVLGAIAAVTVFPEQLGVGARTPFVQVVAFRPQVSAALVVAALLVLWRARRAWPVALALGLVGVLGLAVVAPRAAGAAAEDAVGGGDRLSVLSVNAYLGRADPDDLAAVVRRTAPDVVVLPEAGGELRRTLQRALDDDEGGSGYRSYVADARTDDSPMTVFVARGLGRPTVAADRDTEFPSLVVDLRDGTRVVATHPQSPRPGDTFAWRRDVAALARWCSAGRPTVVAGDLNSTLDHAEFRAATDGCSDAASDVGAGLTGTWPAGLPRILGAQIDHVLLAGGPRAETVEIVDIEGSDHRGVLARLRVG